uniref:non-specific serine/threonine protein kinase n=1 Tax=Parastrongyloides trichosuri TaxID=131310 RepID=A0A0N4ZV81_PARTI
MHDVPTLEKGVTINCDFARFKVKKLLGKGGFGAVYLVEETVGHKLYAVKTELLLSKHEKFVPKLQWEETILLTIQDLKNENYKKHFIKVVDRGTLPNVRFMLMTLVGKSLQDLKKARRRYCFSENTCWRIAIQTLEALEAFHVAGFVHRDIKPANYTIGGPGQEDIIFMIDFGLVRCYTKKKFSISVKDSPNFAGTIKYCSRSSHHSVYQFPKDDLECWIMTILDLHHPDALYWGRAFDIEEIKECKNELFTGHEPDEIFDELVPSEYRKIVHAIGNLTPHDLLKIPNDYMKNKINMVPFFKALENMSESYGFSNTKPFDWQKELSKRNKMLSTDFLKGKSTGRQKLHNKVL